MTRRDILSRLTRALEALRDGERDLGEVILDDLIAELWAAIEAKERPA